MKKNASDILAESAIREAFSNDTHPPSGWPKTYTITASVYSFYLALIAREEGDEDVVIAINGLLKLDELWAALSDAEIGDDSFEGDDGLIMESPADAESVIQLVEEHDSGFVRNWIKGGIQTANANVSRAIGNWLKSIDVPFRYNIDPDAE